MSGPKVIRTVTIEELHEAARIQLTLIDIALERWREEIVSREESTRSRFDDLIGERNRIAAMLETNQFDDMAMRAEILVAAVRHDIERSEEERDTQTARNRVRERSMRHTARSILSRCLKDGVDLSGKERNCLEMAANGAAFDASEVAFVAADVLERTTEPNVGNRHKDQLELARSLLGESSTGSARVLLDQMKAELEDPRIATVEKWIAELERLGDSRAVEQFRDRLSGIVADGEPRSKGLSLDALGLDLSRATLLAREHAELRRGLASEIAAANVTNDLTPCQQAIRDAEHSLEARDLEHARLLVEQIRGIREACRKARAAGTARNTILSGLKELGYDVREGMPSTWTSRKRLLVRYPGRPGVALELSGDGESGRLQTRMVAVQGETRDPQTDRQVEETWCGDLEKLIETVSRTGGAVRIEKALPVGAIPLKLVADDSQEASSEMRSKIVMSLQPKS